jgi:hypothetical protein
MSEEKTKEKSQKSPFERVGHSMKMWGVMLGGLAALVGGGTTLAVKGTSAWHEIHANPTATATSSPLSQSTVSAFSPPSPLSTPSSSASSSPVYVPAAAGLSTPLTSGQSEPAGCSEAIATYNTYLAAARAANNDYNLPAVANDFQEMNTLLTSDESLASNTNVRIAIFEVATDANDIAYESGHDEVTAADGALTKLTTDAASLNSACNL